MAKPSDKVSDVYGIDEALLDQLASSQRKGEYFEKSLKFYNEVKHKNVGSLTSGQKNWLNTLDGILSNRSRKNQQRNTPSQDNSNEGFFSRLLDKLTKFFE